MRCFHGRPEPIRRGAPRSPKRRMLPYVAMWDSMSCICRHSSDRAKLPERTEQRLDRGAQRSGEPLGDWIEQGGHTAVEQASVASDFDAFVATAAAQGLEIALDIAFRRRRIIRTSANIPTGFARADGSISTRKPSEEIPGHLSAELRVDDWRGLWHELKGIFEFWIRHGVKIFRVDNPHTKPFRFWEWALAELTRQYPDAIFLSGPSPGRR